MAAAAILKNPKKTPYLGCGVSDFNDMTFHTVMQFDVLDRYDR